MTSPLADGGRTGSVKAIRAVTSSAPIIVVTGADDDPLALACIEAAAQDCLHKGAVSLRKSKLSARNVSSCGRLLEPYLLRETEHLNAPRANKDQVVAQLGDASGGLRDLPDVHMAALDQAMAHLTAAHASTLVFEARLMALQMRGLLVDHDRVGLRRRFTQGTTT